MGIEHDDMTDDERELAAGKAEPKDEPKAEAAETPAVEAAAEEAPPEAEAQDDAAPAVEAAEAAEVAEPAEPVQYRTPTKAEIEAQRETLREQKDKAFSDFDDGVIDRAEFLKLSREIDDKVEELVGQRTLLVANEQQRLAQQGAKLDAIKASAKADGTIDYNDEAAADEFNAALQFVAAVKANAALSFDAIADKAHAMVLAQRGIAPKPVAAAPTPAKAAAPAAPAAPRNVPQTLHGMPPAGASPVGDDVMTQFGALDDPDAAEAMLEAMPAGRREALRRSTMPSGSRH